ncbi:MAG: NAD-dependent epimerase/dehydratase family protein [Gammaproteobacteria bacterium]|nr:NAD-dependent epimerase/dehydratase family protein [Gammaproteobacteria bacterium]
MRILVTGSASHLARVLIPRLLEERDVDEIIGVDRRDSGLFLPRYTEVLLDIRSPQLTRALAGVDAVVHLAFVVMQADLGRGRRDRNLIQDINVRGSQNVFTLAAQSGVRHFVHLSSASVYALPTHFKRALESHPRAALPGFTYAEDKVVVEDWLDGFERDHPDLRLVRLRPHMILGPQSQPFLRALLRYPFYPGLPDPQPVVQCVHEQDVAEAVCLALSGQVRGAFNLACADSASLRTMQRHAHLAPLPVPRLLVEALAKAGWNWLGRGTDPGWLGVLGYSLALDSTRARRELGWKPKFDSWKSVLDAR